MTDRAHGTRVKYVRDKCRCDDCKAANRTAENDRYRQQAYGRWQPYVDARPARAHVRLLQIAGIPHKKVAVLAGVGRGTVERLLYGVPSEGRAPSSGIRPESAAKLLAVPVPTGMVRGSVLVDATGTRRRIQALVCAGWSVAQLASRAGRERSNFWVSVSSDRVELETREIVRVLYNELWRTDPQACGVPAHVVTRARNHARRNGWAPAGAWDDDTIDDTNALPDLGEGPDLVDPVAVARFIEGTDVDLNRLERLAAALAMTDAGQSARAIAARLNVTPRTIIRWRAANERTEAA